MLFVKWPAGKTADLTGRPLQQQNERRPTKRKGQSEVEIVSVCRKDAPHAHLANEIPVMQWKPAARWVLLVLAILLIVVFFAYTISQALVYALAKSGATVSSNSTSILIVLIYFDLRVRREALDLFQLANQLAAPAAAF